MIKKINGYKIYLKDELGKGSFGKVYRGQQNSTGLECAVKVFEKHMIYRKNYQEQVLRQIQLLKSLESQNVVRMIDILESPNNYYLVEELCDGDFSTLLQEREKLPEEEAIMFLRQICNGFVAFNGQGIIHRDLKPANLLLNKGVIKIADLGLGKKVGQAHVKNMTESLVGTSFYSPIQLLTGEEYSEKCDVWSVGCIFYDMLHGQTPWVASSHYQLVQHMQNIPLKYDKGLHAETIHFLKGTLAHDEDRRFDWEEVFRHPIFKCYFMKKRAESPQSEIPMEMHKTVSLKVEAPTVIHNKV